MRIRNCVLTASFVLIAFLNHSATTAQQPSFIDMKEMLDASTLEVEVIRDWTTIKGRTPFKQKTISILVGEFIPDHPYRIPIRLIVPADQKAKGFHLSGDFQVGQIKGRYNQSRVDRLLLAEGFGLVHVPVDELRNGQMWDLAKATELEFAQTLNPRYSAQCWAWPASIMRAITAALADTEHFAPGKIVASGEKASGAAVGVAVIHDKRINSIFAGRSPIWESPLRLCNKQAWDKLNSANTAYCDKMKWPKLKRNAEMAHRFVGGLLGVNHNRLALTQGKTWNDLEQLATSIQKQIFITQNLEDLRARNVSMFFQPGSHDLYCYDLVWGGEHYQDIPLLIKANQGQREGRHPKSELSSQKPLDSWLICQFFDKASEIPSAPKSEFEIAENKLKIKVTFENDETLESGRIWWIYDRGLDGSIEYDKIRIPNENTSEVTFDKENNCWAVEIELQPGHRTIDFYSNYLKTIRHESMPYKFYISSPYTRVELK